jgi:hypothetical protein
MAARTMPLESDSSDHGTWQTLVQDRRYRLFAAGDRRAAIAECIATPGNTLPDGKGFDASFGLNRTECSGPVLLTQVSRAFDVLPGGAKGRRERRAWRWAASHCVQPVSQLKSYIDEQSGLVFFLTRTRGKDADAELHRERLEDSAMRIGRSLGLDGENLEALRVASRVHEMGRVAPPATTMANFSALQDPECAEGEYCAIPECPRTAAATLESHPYCREHFVATCYERLDACREQLGQRRPSDQASEGMRSFLHACIEGATELTRDPFKQDALERARLLDILHTASDLSRRVRRSSRWAKSFAVRLLCETPGRPWVEESQTVLISQHGAMLECAHLVRPEDWLFVESMDSARRVRARMAWRGAAKAGHFAVGLEFMEYENFWGLNWADA